MGSGGGGYSWAGVGGVGEWGGGIVGQVWVGWGSGGGIVGQAWVGWGGIVGQAWVGWGV